MPAPSPPDSFHLPESGGDARSLLEFATHELSHAYAERGRIRAQLARQRADTFQSLYAQGVSVTAARETTEHANSDLISILHELDGTCAAWELQHRTLMVAVQHLIAP